MIIVFSNHVWEWDGLVHPSRQLEQTPMHDHHTCFPANDTGWTCSRILPGWTAPSMKCIPPDHHLLSLPLSLSYPCLPTMSSHFLLRFLWSPEKLGCLNSWVLFWALFPCLSSLLISPSFRNEVRISQSEWYQNNESRVMREKVQTVL